MEHNVSVVVNDRWAPIESTVVDSGLTLEAAVAVANALIDYQNRRSLDDGTLDDARATVELVLASGLMAGSLPIDLDKINDLAAELAKAMVQPATRLSFERWAVEGV